MNISNTSHAGPTNIDLIQLATNAVQGHPSSEVVVVGTYKDKAPVSQKVLELAQKFRQTWQQARTTSQKRDAFKIMHDEYKKVRRKQKCNLMAVWLNT